MTQCDIEVQLKSMRRATQVYCNKMIERADQISLMGKNDEIAEMAQKCFRMLDVVQDEVQDFLAKNGSDLWERGERDRFLDFVTEIDEKFTASLRRAIMFTYVRDQKIQE